MSNIVLKGDVIQDLGEYLPNPYIERIEVTTTEPDQIGIEIQYSLLFMISDEYDANDIIEQLNNINLFACFKSENTASQLSKNEVMFHLTNTMTSTFVDFNFYQLDSESIIEKLSNGDYADDLYDSEDRRVLKVSATTRYNLETTRTRLKFDLKNDKIETLDVEQYTEHVYCYMLSSLLDSATLITSTTPKAYLNTSNIAYEKVFSPGLNVLREEEVIYLGTQGEKYGYTPLLALNRNYYKTQTISRETIISKVNSLINRFENRSAGPLADSVSSIKYVLGEESESENLLVELDKVRRSFPNKTNNNPVGNLYSAYSKLLQNINSSFPPSDRLTKQKYLTGKVVDMRGSNLSFNPPTTGGGGSPLSQNLFFIDRQRISDADDDAGAQSNGSRNYGVFMLKFEEMIKQNSVMAEHFDVDRLYNVTLPDDLGGLKRMLYSYLKMNYASIKKSNGATVGMSLSALIYDPSPPLGGSVYQQSTLLYGGIGLREYYDTQLETTFNNDLIEYDFNFADQTQNKIRCFYFQDLDSYSARYEVQEAASGGIKFIYDIEVSMEDLTGQFVKKTIIKYVNAMGDLKDYKDYAQQVCSYNNLENRFNDFFINSISEEFGVKKPWEFAPTIYSVLAYILKGVENFETADETRKYARNLINEISPQNGSLESLVAFYDLMDGFYTDVLSAISPERSPIETGKSDDDAGNLLPVISSYSLSKEVFLIANDYQALMNEAQAELIQEPVIIDFRASTNDGNYIGDESRMEYDLLAFYDILAALFVDLIKNIVIVYGLTSTAMDAADLPDFMTIFTNPTDADLMSKSFAEAIMTSIGTLISSQRDKRNQALQAVGPGAPPYARRRATIASFKSDLETKLKQSLESSQYIEDLGIRIDDATLPEDETDRFVLQIVSYYRDNMDKFMNELRGMDITSAPFYSSLSPANESSSQKKSLYTEIALALILGLTGGYDGPDPSSFDVNE